MKLFLFVVMPQVDTTRYTQLDYISTMTQSINFPPPGILELGVFLMGVVFGHILPPHDMSECQLYSMAIADTKLSVVNILLCVYQLKYMTYL